MTINFTFSRISPRESPLYYCQRSQYYNQYCDFTRYNSCFIDFKPRLNFSHGNHHYKRRLNIAEGEIGAWTGTLAQVLMCVDPGPIWNAHEIDWMRNLF
jgi:hypothetical protein